jgi:hypothetical protein
MEGKRRAHADVEAAAGRVTDAQVLVAAEALIAAWNRRQVRRMPLLFASIIGAALATRYYFLGSFIPGLSHLRTLTCTRWVTLVSRSPSPGFVCQD